MENPIILITSSEDEAEGDIKQMKWRSKVDEYRMISDLSGSENLKEMTEAEGSARTKKRKRAKKSRNGAVCEDEYRIISDLSGFDNLKAMIEAEALVRRNKMEKKKKLEPLNQEDATANAANEKDELGKKEAVKIVEASKPGSVQVLEMIEPQNFVIDAVNEKEDASRITTGKTTKGIGIDDGVNSSELINPFLPSSRADRAISDVSCSRGIEDTVGAAVGAREKRRRRKKSKRITEQNEEMRGNNSVKNIKMENPIILIKSSEDEAEGDIKQMKWRSKGVEYRIISDLRGFENLKAMIEAEALNQEDATANAAKEKDELGKEEAVEIVEASKPESVQMSEMIEPQNFVIDAMNEKEDASTITSVETTKGIGVDDGVNSSELIDPFLPSSGADRAISDVSCSRGVEDMVGAVVVVKKKRRRRKKSKRRTEQNKVDAAKEEDDAKDNAVLRMLLRKPRYFDPTDWYWVTCSICGKENHTEASCKVRKRKKACFLCGRFNHIWKYCRQGQDCFIRNRTDHLVNGCPETGQKISPSSIICLICRDSGHDMFSCQGDYSADDLKEIQCYICHKFGHLCCVGFPDTAQNQISCYNCGESGHLGSECPNSCEASVGTNSPVPCYRCGEKGHIARQCSTNLKGKSRARLRICDILPTSTAMTRTGSSSISDNFLQAQERENNPL
ncbi:uncharacterized protein LOC123215806 isoform X1 [Mangifera indica]|uniref:uncharacterized protein LOC123215806 isoform X1 n=1 Tax=Mangifera indica TaxID=29780 RepID=UPI001CF94F74|nr:uncharacterized protein LOC123215806 isoform X1 [Mangifera indica]